MPDHSKLVQRRGPVRPRLTAFRRPPYSAPTGRQTPLLVVQGRESFAKDGYVAASKLLAQNDRPTALFCFNDRVAMGAYCAVQELGLRVPRDLSIVGFDNQEIVADALSPPLTTVALPYYEMGRWRCNGLWPLSSRK